ncbi:hypothetical protein B0H13DRAFT_2337616 [Mycena leptocephala]|nr:hypothetical protein B0H13DRAFT_2337616 [Mycena leptocephala]
MSIFDGEYAVFSHDVPDIYLRHYKTLGGVVVRTKEEMSLAVFFFARTEWDVEFISQFYDQTYRSTRIRIVPAASLPNLPWKGYLQKPKPVKPAELRTPKRSKRKRNMADIGGREEVETEEVAVGFMGLAKMFRGMLTPAASLLNMGNSDRQLRLGFAGDIVY